jgi:hypothetical protein
LALGLLAGVGWSCNASLFRCQDVEQCDGIDQGLCEPNGFCSTPDEDCSSGRAYAPHSGKLSGRCVDDDAAGDQDGTGDGPGDGPGDGTSDAPSETTSGAADASGTDDSSTSGPPTSPDVGGPVDLCDNGLLDPGETDVDCGGECSPCSLCGGCRTDTDCAQGVCDAGVCITVHHLEVDWIVHCGTNDANDVQIDLPAGHYLVRALPSAGSKWEFDESNGGLTWGWRMDCDGFDFGDLRTVSTNGWYATPEDAFAALVTEEIEREHEGGVVSCRLIDTKCSDNRGGTLVDFITLCEG